MFYTIKTTIIKILSKVIIYLMETIKYDYKYYKNININGIRNIKIIQFNNNLIIIGSKVYNEINNKKKYLLYSYLINENFEIIDNSENILNFENIMHDYKNNIYISCWLRDIYIKNNNYFLLIEFKKNNDDDFFTSTHYLLKTNNFINFEIHKNYNIKDFFFKDYDNNYFISKIEKTDHIWGKYLFEFIINGNKIIPEFDDIINYNNDYGHVLHNLSYNKDKNEYYIIFSIRHFSENEKNNFYYKIYEAYSNNLLYYYNTKEINIEFNDNINSKWYCYPWKFNLNNIEYIVCNTDDYGKYKNPIIFSKVIK